MKLCLETSSEDKLRGLVTFYLDRIGLQYSTVSSRLSVDCASEVVAAGEYPVSRIGRGAVCSGCGTEAECPFAKDANSAEEADCMVSR